MDGRLPLGGLLEAWRAVDASIGAPPAYVLPAGLLSLATGRSWLWTNLLHNLPYLALLLVAVFGLARRLAGVRAGWLAAACAALYPASFGFFRTYSMEFALAAVSAAALWQLVESDWLRERSGSAAFGALTAWGLLIKYPFAALIVGPLLVAVWQARADRKRLAHLGLAAAIVLAVAGPFYLSPVRLKHAGGDLLAEARRVESTWRLFTVGLWEQQLSPPFFVALLAALPGFLRVPAAPRLAVLAWALVPIAALALMPHWKHARLLLPHVPAFAVITGAGLARYLNGRRGAAALCALVALGVLQRVELTHGGRLAALAVGGVPYYDDTVAWCYVSRSRALGRAEAPERLWRDAAGALGGLKAEPRSLLLLKRDDAPPFVSTLMFWLNGVPINAQFLPARAADWEKAAAENGGVLWLRGDPAEPAPEDARYFEAALRPRFERLDRWNAPRDGALLAGGEDWPAGARRWAAFMKRFPKRIALGSVRPIEAALYLP